MSASTTARVGRARLVFRIYALAVLSIVATGAVLAAFAHLLMGPPEGGHRHLSHYLEQLLSRPGSVDAKAEAAQALLEQAGLRITVYQPDGRLLLSNVQPPEPPLDTDHVQKLRNQDVVSTGFPPHLAFAYRPQGVLTAYGFVQSQEFYARRYFWVFPLVLLLLGVGVASLLLAHSVGRPLRRLAETALSFGSGDLGARSQLRRGDEIGELSRTFDEMADKIVALLRGQRELLGNVSHELRTPLARIRVALDIAKLDETTDAPSPLTEIAQDLDELERLVSDIIMATRLELQDEATGHAVPPLRLEQLDPLSMISAAAERFGRAHPQHVLVRPDSAVLAPLLADPVLLRRALDNLLDNAGKYSEPGSQVKLTAGVDGDQLELRVTDQGPGIPPEHMTRLFTPFFRGEQSRARQTGGVGLGLTLARRIVEAHGGTLRLESVPGQGTTAILRVPTATIV
ncbi:MAG: HAMP domain-containing sensor histidine kinase [Pseudomonadota bacterium]